MGSGQSKRRGGRAGADDEHWTAEQLQQDSIVAAIAANKRQRKLLLKQAKMSYQQRQQQQRSYHHELTHEVLPMPHRLTQGSRLQSASLTRGLAHMTMAPSPQLAQPPPLAQATLASSRQTSRETLVIGNTLASSSYGSGKSLQERRFVAMSTPPMLVEQQWQPKMQLKDPRSRTRQQRRKSHHNSNSNSNHLHQHHHNYQQHKSNLHLHPQIHSYHQHQQQQLPPPPKAFKLNRHFAELPRAYHPIGNSQSSMSLYSTNSTSSLASNYANNNNHHHQQQHLNTATPIMHHQQTMQSPTSLLASVQNIQPKLQKGLAFNLDERKKLNLLGLLPAAYRDQELQTKAVINFIDNCKDELSKYVYLRNLKDYNERLFYAAITQNVEKLMPLVYTPTVGLACQRFSEIYLRPRGLFITINDLDNVSSILANWPEKDVRVIVVTDGERILGLGDLGANGMGISIGKLSLYTALAGIPPQNVLPITLDVGTNNQFNLDDPFYIGLRHQRIRGEKYDALIEEFMACVVDRWGSSCLIQFEDFANSTAFNLLQRYRDRYCTFNDDIQGTASVCLSGLISATKLIGRRLTDSSYLFFGAGEANLGTANLLIMAMVEEGVTRQEARDKIWLVDSKGLVETANRDDLSSHKRQFAHENCPRLTDLESIIDYCKPQAIIGASAQGGAFSEKVCKKMAQITERPIIFALSNPTSKAECTAEQAYEWTEGKCVFASGSPFEPVVYNGETFITGQGNNAYIFPAVGLAAIAAHVHSIPEETFLVSARALSDQLTPSDISVGLVYPKLSKIREVTLKVASRVLDYFYSERLATYRPEPDDKLNFLRSIQYDYRYEAVDATKPLGQVSLTNANKAANGMFL